MKKLPKYKSHKVVSALQIKEIIRKTDGTAVLKFVEKGYDDIIVSTHYMLKFKPQSGGYYVVYSDKYTSFSPKEAFKNGYKPLEDIISEDDLEKKHQEILTRENSLNEKEEEINNKKDILDNREKDILEKQDLISKQLSEIEKKQKELDGVKKTSNKKKIAKANTKK